MQSYNTGSNPLTPPSAKRYKLSSESSEKKCSPTTVLQHFSFGSPVAGQFDDPPASSEHEVGYPFTNIMLPPLPFASEKLISDSSASFCKDHYEHQLCPSRDSCKRRYPQEEADGLLGLAEACFKSYDDIDSKPKVTVSENDVLCGRGATTNAHLGNIYFRNLVDVHKSDYIAARKNEKKRVAEKVVSLIREKGGRFLKLEDGVYSDISTKKAIEKASQALREGNSEILRQAYARNMCSKVPPTVPSETTNPYDKY